PPPSPPPAAQPPAVYNAPPPAPADHGAAFAIIHGLVTVTAAVDFTFIVGLQFTVPAPIIDRGNQDSNRLFSPGHCHAIKDNGHLGPFLASPCWLHRGDAAMEFSSARHDQ